MIVYIINNLINGKYYIGKTLFTAKERWKQHISEAKQHRNNVYFYKAIRKYGADNFKVDVICTANSPEQLSILENIWIVCLRSFDPKIGYNATFGGEGARLTDEVKIKISTSLINRYKNNPPMMPKRGPLSEFHRQKCSEALKGRIFSDEHRDKLSVAAIGNKNQRPRKHSEETKRKFREAWVRRKQHK